MTVDLLMNVIFNRSCLMCFKTKPNMLNLSEEFQIKCEYFDIKISLVEISKCLFPEFDLLQSQFCYTCSDLLIKMYIVFLRRKHVENMISHALENLFEKLKDCPVLNDQTDSMNHETLINNPILLNLTTKKEKIKKKMSTGNGVDALLQKKIVKNFVAVTYKRTRTKVYYNCSYCAYKTLSKATLDGHTNKKHLNIRPFKCNICWKSFYRKSNLVEHINSHKKTKELCELCGEFFRQKKSLIEHLRLHTNNRPYECNACGKKFITSGRRLDHAKRTHMEKTETCMLCSKLFGLKKELTRHIKNVHKL